MKKTTKTFTCLLVLYLLGTSVFSGAMALLFPLTNYHVSDLVLPWLSNNGTDNSYWLMDNQTDAEYFANQTAVSPYRDFLLSMEADERFSYIVCIGQSIYPKTEALGDFIRGMVINQRSQDYFSISISEGRVFCVEDYSIDGQEDIPILIGAGLHKSLSVGDSFHASYFGKDCSFRVVGVLAVGTTLYRLDNPVDMDDRVLIPAFFPSAANDMVFQKAMLQSYYDAVIIVPRTSFSKLYKMLWEKAQMYQIGMIGFGRVAPLLQDFSNYRNALGTVLAFLLPLLFICLRLLIYIVNLPYKNNDMLFQWILLPTSDIVVYLLIVCFCFATEYSFAIPWQYYSIECILCVIAYAWRKVYVRNT